MKNYMWRNGLALGLISGICATLLFLTFVSSIPIGGENSTSDWLSSIATVSSVVISIFAVVLVSSTLKATEETLHATKELGLNQTRAWVLVKSIDIVPIQNTNLFEIQVTFQNFGQSPATDLRSEVYVHNDRYPFGARPLQRPTTDFSINDLPPNSTFQRIMESWEAVSTENFKTQIRISFSYKLLDDKKVEVFDTWVVEKDGQGLYARKFMPVDSINYKGLLAS